MFYMQLIQSDRLRAQTMLLLYHFGLRIRTQIKAVTFVRGGPDTSLARPTSQCRRTESIVSLERGVCSCAELQVFSCYRG